jgi:hypothetical protein
VARRREGILKAAALGAGTAEVSLALRMALLMEGVECQLK